MQLIQLKTVGGDIANREIAIGRCISFHALDRDLVTFAKTVTRRRHLDRIATGNIFNRQVEQFNICGSGRQTLQVLTKQARGRLRNIRQIVIATLRFQMEVDLKKPTLVTDRI